MPYFGLFTTHLTLEHEADIALTRTCCSWARIDGKAGKNIFYGQPTLLHTTFPKPLGKDRGIYMKGDPRAVTFPCGQQMALTPTEKAPWRPPCPARQTSQTRGDRKENWHPMMRRWWCTRAEQAHPLLIQSDIETNEVC